MADRYKRKETNFYCEYCNVWMADHPAVKANHDSGAKHKANVAKKLSDMRQRSDREEKERVSNERAMAQIEAAAKRKFEADKAAEEEHRQAQLGKWEFHTESGYYYNAVHRWYYDLKTKMYYGGEPADWTNTPKIPKEAYYAAANKPKPPPPPPPSTTSYPPAAVAASGAQGVVSTSGRVPQTVLPGMKIVHAHPQAGVGGYQMPEVGKIGGAKGVGSMISTSGGGARGGGSSGTGDVKRKRDGGDGAPAKPLSKDEAEFLARREAARQRVQARSMQSFGLG